jgi:hypothetical protein
MGEGVRHASFGEVGKTVLAGFLGVRRRADHERAALRPWQVIVAALAGAALLVLTLVTIVRLVAG